jgi:ATP-binding cassette subfamily F protein 3
MMSDEAAFKIRDAFPLGTIDEVVVQYLAGLVEDPDEDPADVIQVTHDMLRSAVSRKEFSSAVEQLASSLAADVRARAVKREIHVRPTLQRLDNVVEMSKAGALSNTIGFAEGVDLSSVNKGKWVTCVH